MSRSTTKPFINLGFIKKILKQLPADKVCQLEGNKRLQSWFNALVASALKHHRTEKEIVSILKKQFQLIDGEDTLNGLSMGV